MFINICLSAVKETKQFQMNVSLKWNVKSTALIYILLDFFYIGICRNKGNIPHTAPPELSQPLTKLCWAEHRMGWG